jgi:hypothetical protein
MGGFFKPNPAIAIRALEPHDVGTEYAVYMVGSPAKSAFSLGREGRPALTPHGALPIRPRFLKGPRF